MSELVKENIQSLEKKIEFWQSKLNGSKNPVESAVLSDKIAEARKYIEMIKSGNNEKKVSTQVDAPALVDRISGTIKLDRGQIMNSNEVFL